MKDKLEHYEYLIQDANESLRLEMYIVRNLLQLFPYLQQARPEGGHQRGGGAGLKYAGGSAVTLRGGVEYLYLHYL